MHQRDSIDKIVNSYFACVTKESFTYKGKEYLPKPLIVSPLLQRGYTCPSTCGGCCMTISLDWLPFEKRPDDYRIVPRDVEFDGKSYTIFSDMQYDNLGHYCRHVIPDNGRCAIHEQGKPFSADFELIRFSVFSNPKQANRLNQRLYGRGWSYLRVDGDRGALCEMTPISEESRMDTIRRMCRLKEWTDFFGLDTIVPEIILWLRSGVQTEQLTLNQNKFDSTEYSELRLF